VSRLYFWVYFFNLSNFEILDFRTFQDGFYIKIKAVLKDGSELYIREYVDVEERNYSYHWQDKEGKLIIRWDNAPHHKNIRTYPHHKHVNNKVRESFETTCEKILSEISEFLRK
jgi:hypothetical protein